MITAKTGYPKDMLELDLDMEADLGIDTVKQAELFAALREHYNIARKDTVSLKDYPTIRHCIKFVMEEKGGTVGSQESRVVSQTATAPISAPKPAPAPTPDTRPSTSVDSAAVEAEILNMIAEKTGYPKDMLELDLDMEADLGIDTVKQAELFAALASITVSCKDNISSHT